jgi:hypothetical protein
MLNEFAGRCFEDSSINCIVAYSGISKSSFYPYFKDKHLSNGNLDKNPLHVPDLISIFLLTKFKERV